MSTKNNYAKLGVRKKVSPHSAAKPASRPIRTVSSTPSTAALSNDKIAELAVREKEKAAAKQAATAAAHAKAQKQPAAGLAPLLVNYDDEDASTIDEDFAPMTVYRILNFLEDQSLVHKLQSTNKYVVCANINDSAVHKLPQFLICNSCKKVDEIFLDDGLIEAVCINIKKKGFYVSEPRFELKGLCENCHND